MPRASNVYSVPKEKKNYKMGFVLFFAQAIIWFQLNNDYHLNPPLKKKKQFVTALNLTVQD